ncbi:MAG: antitoxin VapB family protein [Candidatus Methanospirareceae archaeon]
MVATKRIPVSQEIWEELNRLKEPGQTFDDLLEELLEREKKLKLIKDMKRIEETAEFVEL